MAKFIVIHKGPKNVSQEEIIQFARGLRRSIPEDVKWLNSWYVSSENKLICEWEAENEEKLKKVLKLVEALWPSEKTYEVLWVDPDWYK